MDGIRQRATRRVAGAVGTVVALVATAAVPASAAGDPGSASRESRGMTWVVRQQTPVGLVNVGADSATDAYHGDTPATATLPMLCLYVDGSPVPQGITPNFYNGWARGWVGLTPPIPGTALTSRSVADQICASRFGAQGWRMAEHHDGWYGDPPARSHWHFWAHGALPAGTRFWSSIDDQPANPWN